MPIEDQSRCVYSPGCSSVGTQCSPTPLYENVDNFGELMEALRYNDLPTCFDQGTANVHPITKHHIDSSIKSFDSDHKTPYNTVDNRSTIRAKRPIDMRPLSLPMPNSKRRGNIQRRSYVCLAMATAAVFGIAFAIWLLYDSVEKFVVSVVK